MEPRDKHDFTNNCLRIEILQKMMMEDLAENSAIKQEHARDYLRFLEQQKNFLQKNVPKAAARS